MNGYAARQLLLTFFGILNLIILYKVGLSLYADQLYFCRPRKERKVDITSCLDVVYLASLSRIRKGNFDDIWFHVGCKIWPRVIEYLVFIDSV